MRADPPEAAEQFGVFTVRQALMSGWSRAALDRAVRREELQSLRRGTFIREALLHTSDTDPEDRRIGLAGAAAALTVTNASVTHTSAVALYGLPLLTRPLIACVTLPPPLRTRPAALHVHRQPILDDQLHELGALRMTSVARSCIDHTREAGLASGLVAVDAALHRGLMTQQDLADAYGRCHGRAGLRTGRRLVELADGRSESPLETVSRLSMAHAQIPAPHLQTVLRDLNGEFLARADFYWPPLGVVGEADGRAKYTGDELWREKRREARLTDRGLVVVRWDWTVGRNPILLQDQLDRAFARAGQLRAAGVMPAVLAST